MEYFYKAEVVRVIDEGEKQLLDMTVYWQKLMVRFIDGDQKNSQMTLETSADKNQWVKSGDTVVVAKTIGPNDQPVFNVMDQYRLPSLWPIILAFFLLVIFLSRLKGLGSIIGMIFSLLVIVKFIVPQILAGKDPLLISIGGGLIIMLVTIYLAHGFSAKTTLALVSTFLTLVATAVIAAVFVKITALSGIGDETTYSLKYGPTAIINFKGLLLGGILIGALGVLDDVTTGLATAIFELKQAKPAAKFHELYRSGLNIGREHIASLVNTLVLAYAGASLPIFIIIIYNPNQYPLWTILNSEILVTELVRTLAGSIALVLAVPLTTFLAAVFVSRKVL